MDTGITAQMQDDYRRNGIVKVEQLISRAQAAHYREATLALLASTPEGGSARYGHTFHQYVDVWRDDETLRGLTLHPRIGAIAEQLAGIPMRLWHDHTLAKEPAKAAPTAFHQDQMKWPFAAPRHTLSAWIALQDTPVERTFHHGMIMHAAGANTTEDWRVAHVIIFADRAAVYSGQDHLVTDPLALRAGDAFPDELFPPVGS